MIKFKKSESNDLVAAKRREWITDIQNNFFERSYDLRNIADAEDALRDHQG